MNNNENDKILNKEIMDLGSFSFFDYNNLSCFILDKVRNVWIPSSGYYLKEVLEKENDTLINKKDKILRDNSKVRIDAVEISEISYAIPRNGLLSLVNLVDNKEFLINVEDLKNIKLSLFSEMLFSEDFKVLNEKVIQNLNTDTVKKFKKNYSAKNDFYKLLDYDNFENDLNNIKLLINESLDKGNMDDFKYYSSIYNHMKMEL